MQPHSLVLLDHMMKMIFKSHVHVRTTDMDYAVVMAKGLWYLGAIFIPNTDKYLSDVNANLCKHLSCL